MLVAPTAPATAPSVIVVTAVADTPVVTALLAGKVRVDWAGLDAQGHEASLRADLKTRPFPGEALVRLRFYYPNAYAALDVDDAKKRDKFEAEERKAREREAGATTP